MDRLNVFYRALIDYRKQTEDNRACGLERRAVVSSNPESDTLDITRIICTVEEDWINAIEEGLEHIEKAINEARQFIRSQGDVVPIEKAKRVSKDSVEHLAKHSDMITREPEDDDLIPDKLYIVERLSDFAVYENKFLYMLLCYLKSFISLRYDKILELTNTYRGDVTMNKVVAMNKRKIAFKMEMTDESQDDWYLKQNNELQPLIDRISMLLKVVNHLLSTPLMQEVGKVPMLKPPIVKTNVLKMNKNFKGAVTLYDFVTAYDKAGYTVETRKEHTSPFDDGTADEFAEAVMLISFLAYKNGLNLNKYLKNLYEEEEARLREEELERQKEQLKQLKKRIAESGGDPIEYMLLLEKRNKALEIDSIQLAAARQDIEKLQAEAEIYKENILSLNTALEEKQTEIATINQKHIEETAKLNAQHQQEIVEINERHETETEQLKQEYEAEIDAINQEHETAVAALNEEHRAETEKKDGKISELEEKLVEEQKQYNEKLAKAEQEYLRSTSDFQIKCRAEVAKLEELNIKKNLEFEYLMQEKILSDSRLNALRKEYKLIREDEDFTTRASFEELEHQFKVFKKFFNDEWNKTKKRIKKEVFEAETENKQKKR